MFFPGGWLHHVTRSIRVLITTSSTHTHMAELLLSRQGPLAHVWLASNYDKKLSKQQLLSTNIIASSNILSSRQLQSSSHSSNDTITLRLSGQLLLGIVRIYSRKTKYLLDDINECLYKLKSSFKYASGASLGTAVSTVNLPPQRTTITNFSRLLLQDQVTALDLFYQEELNLDNTQTNHDLLFSHISSLNQPEENPLEYSMDRSIEIGRRQSDINADQSMDVDMDMDFDLDLDLDHSIEQGRDAQAPLLDADQSILDVQKEPETPIEDILGAPLDTIDVSEQEESVTPITHEPRRLVGIADGVVKTTKRKLMVDSSADLERGLPNDVLKSIQHLQTYGHFTKETLTLKLSEREKLQLVEELAEPVSAKRRKIRNLDSELRERCAQLSDQERDNFDLDNALDFDLSLPGLEPDTAEKNTQQEAPQEEQPQEDAMDNVCTTQVAEQLRRTFFEKPTVTFDELMENDADSTTNPRRAATQNFFELLVLATHNCISLEQEDALMGALLTVRPRDDLVTKFT